MARGFPTITIWEEQTKRSLTGGSAEFQCLDRAFRNYSNARDTKGPSGQPVTTEYNELKRTFDLYMAKKEANANNLHLFGTVNRDGNGILTGLRHFLNANSVSSTDEQEDIAMVNYTFERALRLKTSLGNARVELKKETESIFVKVKDKLEEIKSRNILASLFQQKTLFEQLKESEARELAKSKANSNAKDIAKDFLKQGAEAYSEVSNARDAIFGAVQVAPPDASTFEGRIALALGVAKDHVFDKMIEAAKNSIGKQAYSEIVALLPVISIVAGAAKVANGLYDAAVCYQQRNECGEVRRQIIAPGDPDSAFAALEKMLDESFKRATVAAAEGALKFAAGFDPTNTAASVVGAVSAVAHLFEAMISFGLQYYQMEAANKILKSWVASPLNGEVSIAFGLKSVSRVRQEIKARRAAGSIDPDQFTEAMQQCPLVGCYFIASLPVIDLLEMVVADVAYNSSGSFFQMHLKIESQRVSALVDLARKALEESKFRIVQNKGDIHQLMGQLEKENVERHQRMHTERVAEITAFNAKHIERFQIEERKAKLNAFTKKHLELQTEKKIAHESEMSALAAMLAERKKREDEAAAQLAEITRRAEEVETQKLIARKQAIANAIETYEAETSGLQGLFTVRNAESTEARDLLKNLILMGNQRPALIKLESVAMYLMTYGNHPREYPALRPLRDASRLKRLLQENYKNAP